MEVWKSISGKWIYEKWGMSPRSVLLRTVQLTLTYLFAGGLLLAAIVHVFTSRNAERTDYGQRDYGMYVGPFLHPREVHESEALKLGGWAVSAIFAVGWAVYSALRQEFVSKYLRLSGLHDQYVGPNPMTDWANPDLPRDGNDVYKFTIRFSPLNFVDDCINYSLAENSSFKETFLHVMSLLVYQRCFDHKGYKESVEDCAHIEKYIEKHVRNLKDEERSDPKRTGKLLFLLDEKKLIARALRLLAEKERSFKKPPPFKVEIVNQSQKLSRDSLEAKVLQFPNSGTEAMFGETETTNSKVKELDEEITKLKKDLLAVIESVKKHDEDLGVIKTNVVSENRSPRLAAQDIDSNQSPQSSATG